MASTTIYKDVLEDNLGNIHYLASSADLVQFDGTNSGFSSGSVTAEAALKELKGNIGQAIITVEGSGADTKYYIQSGADTASKKELGNNVQTKTFDKTINQTTNALTITFDITSISNYKELTLNNLIFTRLSMTSGYFQGNQSVPALTGMAFNPDTGVASVIVPAVSSWQNNTATSTIRLYVVF